MALLQGIFAANRRRQSAGGDPNFANVGLLLHMDGADGSTTFTDSSSGAKTVTPNGNAQIDTAQSKFGGAAGLFDGTGDYLTVADHADFEFGSGDFTIEFWARFASVSGIRTLVGKRANTSSFGPFSIYSNGTTLNLASSSNGTSWDITSASAIGTVAADTWYHIAITRSGNTIRKFLDGVKNGTDLTTSATLIDNANALHIGADTNGQGFNGWIDDLRITKGVARYTATFTPPTAAFPNS